VKVVKVTWKDAYFEPDKSEEPWAVCCSVGYLVKNNSDSTVLAMDLDLEGETRFYLTIPKVSIITIETLCES